MTATTERDDITEVGKREAFDEPVQLVSGADPGQTFRMPGAVVLFVGRRGGGGLTRLRRAFADRATAADLSRDLHRQFSAPRLPLAAAGRVVDDQPVYADVWFEGRGLAQALFPPGPDGLAMVVFPYTGGGIDPAQLVLRQQVRPGAPDRLEGLAVVTPPALTAAERFAATLDDDTPAIGTAKWCETTWRAVAVLAAIAATAGLAVISTSDVTPLEEQEIDVEKIRRLAPRLGAGELMSFRATELARSGASRQ